MKKFFHAALVLPLMLFAVSCSESNDDGGGNDEPIKLSPGTELKQEAFADEEQALAPIKFTAAAPWTATVTDTTPVQAKTKAEAGRVDWLTLSAYSGGTGNVSLTMTLEVNTTGHDRKAKIRIACGDTTIVITVEQKGKTESGEVPEDPDKPKPEPIELTGETPTQQTVWADETLAPAPIRFTATGPWTATVAEVGGKADAGRVDWLALSAYNGEAGEVSLTATLSPNYTGADRKAEIRIACGDKTIVLTVEQKGTKADGTIPEDPNKPELSDLKNRIVRIEENWSGKLNEYYEFKYDEAGRVIGIKRFQYGDGNYEDVEENTTVTYGDKTIVYEIESKEGTYQYWTCTDTAVLDENGRVVSDEYKGVEEYDGKTDPYEVSYRFAYDDGYLVKTEGTYKDLDQCWVDEITWTDGNPTQVVGYYNNEETSDIDRATYGTIENKANLDLNWLIALRTEGWRFSVGDNLLPAATGYMGKRSKYMAETVTRTAESDNHFCTNEYQFDSEGRIVKITSKDNNGDTDIYTIRYAE